jgi:O-glycosyl hydrolase
MKPLAFKALEGGLKALDQDISLRASAQWFKAAGFGGFGNGAGAGTKAPATAEEVAARLLNQVNVQVNINTSTGGSAGGDTDSPPPTDHQGQPTDT